MLYKCYNRKYFTLTFTVAKETQNCPYIILTLSIKSELQKHLATSHMETKHSDAVSPNLFRGINNPRKLQGGPVITFTVCVTIRLV